ncbi:MAG: glycosyltransferase family 39 protein [Dehalococcoidia bacterium]
MSERTEGSPSLQPSTTAAGAPATGLAVSISVEIVIWLAVIGLAAALRLARLDHLPLAIDESVRAFAAWQTSEGNTPTDWPGDMTASLSAYLFSIFGPSDFLARLLPALAGAGLVALFWPLSRHVGGAALVAAGLVALSPLFVHASRSSLPYSVGAFLSLAMVLCLLAYLRTHSPVYLFALILSLGLALGSDPISISTALLLLAFLAYEMAWRRDRDVLAAAELLRQNPLLLISSVLFFLGALELGVTHFGTSIDRLSLPGLRQWVDMFALPRDSLPWHFHPGILASYEAPILLLGGLAYFWLLNRWITSRGAEVSIFQRLLFFWASGAALIIAITTRREAGQLVLLLLPLALLAGSWLERIAAETTLASLGRTAPYLAPVLALAGYMALVLCQWAHAGAVGSAGEKTGLIFAAGAAIALIWVAWGVLGHQAIAGMLALALILLATFAIHGSTAVMYGRGSEFLAAERVNARVFQLEGRLAALRAETPGPIAVHQSFLPALGWYLRDVKGVVFAPSPPADVVAIVTPPGTSVPSGYRWQETWPIAEGWLPRSIDALDWWRWLVYRQPWGDLSSPEADLLVRIE